MKITGGMAFPRGVQLTTENYNSVARRGRDGNIFVKTTQRPKVETGLASSKYFPYLLKPFLPVLAGMKWTEFVFTGILVAIFLLLPSSAEPAAEGESWGWPAEVMIILAILIFFRMIGGYHAAEHMAIQAYKKHDVAGLDRLHEQNRVYDRCGGILLVPLLVCFYGGELLTTDIEAWWTWLVPFVLLEIVFRVDHHYKLESFAITRESSRLLQRFITTRSPNEEELEVGRAALRALMIAEGEIDE